MPNHDGLLILSGVSFQYPGNAWRLEGCSLTLKAGEIKGIVGPNGSGKSTLLKAAACMIKPEAGRVILNGAGAASLSHRKRARLMGCLPQHVRAHLDYTAGEVVSMGRYARLKGAGFMDRGDLQIIAGCLEKTLTVHLRDRPFSSLSGGEQQRVLLASVLAQEPRVLLLDEPTSAMDMHHQVRFFHLLQDLAGRGMAVAVVTHDLNMASMFSHHLILMKDGRIVQEGPPGEILSPQVLSGAYGPGMEVVPHPETGRPMVLPSAGCHDPERRGP